MVQFQKIGTKLTVLTYVKKSYPQDPARELSRAGSIFISSFRLYSRALNITNTNDLNHANGSPERYFARDIICT
jgi:hypothetical protein